jgi:hypothetical protein
MSDSLLDAKISKRRTLLAIKLYLKLQSLQIYNLVTDKFLTADMTGDKKKI